MKAKQINGAYRGVRFNKKFGWIYYENYNDSQKTDFRQFFDKEEDATKFFESRNV